MQMQTVFITLEEAFLKKGNAVDVHISRFNFISRREIIMAVLTLIFVFLVTIGLCLSFGFVMIFVDVIVEQDRIEQDRREKKLINSHHD